MEPAPGYRLLKLYRALLAPALAALDAETAHHLAIAALRAGLLRGPGRPADPRLRVRLAGLDLPGPVGLAAGFDKNGEVADAMLALGFGFVEIGTVTPRPQAGNPRPRIFRLPGDEAIINRLGFNNDGHEAAARSSGRPPRQYRRRQPRRQQGLRRPHRRLCRAASKRCGRSASYFAVNISSPNTPGLRDLQGKAALAELLDTGAGTPRRDGDRRRRAPSGFPQDRARSRREADGRHRRRGRTDRPRRPDRVQHHARADRATSRRHERGRRAFRPAVVRALDHRARTDAPASDEAADHRRWRRRVPRRPRRTKIEAGADAVQLYTAMVYEGPLLAARIHRDLAAMLDREGAPSIAAWKGRATARGPAANWRTKRILSRYAAAALPPATGRAPPGRRAAPATGRYCQAVRASATMRRRKSPARRPSSGSCRATRWRQ